MRDVHVVWDYHFDVGIEEIDQQHRELIIIYNRLVDTCTGNEQPLQAAVVINELTGKIKDHTRAEEELLVSHGYPQAEAHSLEHSSFIRKIEDLENRFLTGGSPDQKLGTVQVIGRKLVDHTTSDDVDGFQFVRSRAHP